MSELRLEWDPQEKDTLRKVRIDMLSAPPMEVYEVFKTKNFRWRSIHAMRPKLKELDNELKNGTRKRATVRCETSFSLNSICFYNSSRSSH
jgi:hypothetical protein